MEFIETEHTPKNIAIKAVRKGGFNKSAYDEYTAVSEDKEFYLVKGRCADDKDEESSVTSFEQLINKANIIAIKGSNFVMIFFIISS